jgi:hypothetical protein
MSYSLPIIMMIVTVAILILGIILMALGDRAASNRSTKLMFLRVVSQAVVVILIGIIYFLQR